MEKGADRGFCDADSCTISTCELVLRREVSNYVENSRTLTISRRVQMNLDLICKRAIKEFFNKREQRNKPLSYYSRRSVSYISQLSSLDKILSVLSCLNDSRFLSKRLAPEMAVKKVLRILICLRNLL